jgi:hypothetical protein
MWSCALPDNDPMDAANVRAAGYFVARTHTTCRRCRKSTRLMAVALPQDHQTLQEGSDDGEHCAVWQFAAGYALLFYIEHLCDGVRRRLIRLSPFFRLTYSPSTLNSYWANHCEYCDALLEDHDLHCEPGGAFMPSSATAAAHIELQHILEPFAARASGYAFEPAFFALMRST